MAKFSVGEIAVVAPNAKITHTYTALMPGDEVEVVELAGNERRLHRPSWFRRLLGEHDTHVEVSWDYKVRDAAGCLYICGEGALRKRPQRGIPESVLRIFETPIKRGEPA
ncbi:MAG: hypothetical protein RJA36_1392 [Pseudomonadota bacterium]|jgi:hypothetical protein